MKKVMEHEREEVDLENDGVGGGGEAAMLRDERTKELEGIPSSFWDRDGGETPTLREPLLGLKGRVNTTSQIAIVGANVSPIESLDYEYVRWSLCANFCFFFSFSNNQIVLVLMSFCIFNFRF